MTRDQLTAFVQSISPDSKPGTNKQFAEFIVGNDQIHSLCEELKKNESTKMDYLFCETAVDRKDGFHMLYHVTSSSFGHSIMLRTILTDKTKPEVQSVSDVWRAAEFYEREIFDLFGIQFSNHPDLRRIFLDDDWVGYPLRKDYKDDFMLVR
jgi:NADH-quinone oxidoreductase subunit C